MSLKIPLYSRQVEPASLPNVKMADVVDPNAYGVGALQGAIKATEQLETANKGVQALGDAVVTRAGQLMDEQDRTEATDRVAKYLKDANDYTARARQLRGLEAKDIAKKGEAELTRLEGVYSAQLTNPRQRQFFKQAVTDSNLKFSNALYSHEVQELFSAGEKADLAMVEQLAVSMVDASPEEFASGKQRIRSTIEGRYLPAYGKDYVDNIFLKQMSGVHAEKIKSISVAQGANAGLAYAVANKKEMDPVTYNTVTKALQNRVQITDDKARVRSLVQQLGYDGAMKAIQSGKLPGGGELNQQQLAGAIKPFLGMGYVLGGDGKTSIDCGKFTQDVLSSLGYDVKTRLADEQYLHFEKAGSLHSDPAQLKPGDLVFYENKNSKTWAPTDDPNNTDPGKAYKGVTHVGIYIGGGKIVHASLSAGKVVEADMDLGLKIAGYGSTGAAAASQPLTPERQQDMLSYLRADAAQDHYMKQMVKQQAMTDLKNSLVDVTDKARVVELIQGANGLEKYEKDALIKSVLAKRDKSDPNVKGELHLKLVDGTLTPAMVDSFAEYLSTADMFDLKEKLIARENKQGDSDGRSADDKWTADLKTAFPNSTDANTRNQMAAMVVERLDRENVKGWQRYSRAQELFREGGVVVDGKGNSTAAKTVIQYGQINSARLGYQESIYGKDLVKLAYKGHSAISGFTSDPKAADKLQMFLERLGTDQARGPVDVATLRFITDAGIPLNDASYSDAYGKVYEAMQKWPKHLPFDQNRLNKMLLLGR